MNVASLGKFASLRTILFIVGALGAGTYAAKSVWLDTPVINVPVASGKPTNKVIESKSKQTDGATSKTTKALKSSKTAAAPAAPVKNENREEIPVANEHVAAPPSPKRVRPEDVDSSSDTEGLFVISALKEAGMSHANTAPAPTPAAQTAVVTESDNNALGERVVTPAPKVGSVTDGLGAMFIDDTHGYHMRFPGGWSIRRFDGQPWVVECGDGRSALMNVGFSSFPAEYTADNIPLDWVARRTKKRSDTVLNAQGYATIMGRKALWSKSTGPIQIGADQVKVVRTTYILPLGDGRIAEIRIAATPEQFEKLAGLMKNSVSTFRLLGAKSDQRTVARTE
jgi:hypothetical protein